MAAVTTTGIITITEVAAVADNASSDQLHHIRRRRWKMHKNHGNKTRQARNNMRPREQITTTEHAMGAPVEIGQNNPYTDGAAFYSTGTGDAPTYHYHQEQTYQYQYNPDEAGMEQNPT